jgi:hypothetical protein
MYISFNDVGVVYLLILGSTLLGGNLSFSLMWMVLADHLAIGKNLSCRFSMLLKPFINIVLTIKVWP